MKINYYSTADVDYVNEVKKCRTLKQLFDVILNYRVLAEDAYNKVDLMNEGDFKRFLIGMKKETAGDCPGDKWVKEFGMIILPEKILKISLIASQYHVPFGAAYHRIEQQMGAGSP